MQDNGLTDGCKYLILLQDLRSKNSTFCTIIMPYVLAVESLEPPSLEKLLILP